MITQSTPLQRLWLKALMFSLFGYALLGKSFAYLFIGELVLVAGFFIYVPSQKFMLIFNDPVLFLWGLFAAWGLCRTLPFLSIYRLDAVRDAVLWGYGLFMLLIVAFVRQSIQISNALNAYRKFLRWLLPVLPALLALSTVFADKLPHLPWAADVTVVDLKTGDAAVNLAAAALFLLIFPDRQFGIWKQGASLTRIICFCGWSLTATIVLVSSRGGLAAMVLSIGLASILRYSRIGWKVTTLTITGACLGLCLIVANPFPVHIKGSQVGPDLVAQMATSMVSGDSAQGHEGTKEWRLIWWRHIIRDTMFGPYFWTGRGFGVNLAIEYGPPNMSLEALTLRSPHNASMTVLGRMGVPGLLIWVALNIVFAWRMFSAYIRTNRLGLKFWSGVNLLIFCYWLAALINMSFDVYLEGPQGGIWFWAVMGFGVAALRVQKFEARQFAFQSNSVRSDARLVAV